MRSERHGNMYEHFEIHSYSILFYFKSLFFNKLSEADLTIILSS